MKIVALLVLLSATALAHAQVFRWVDAKGTVHYSDKPPAAGTRHSMVDIEAKAGPPSADTAECHTVRCQGERMEERMLRRQESEARIAAARQAAAPAATPAPHGLEFRKFIMLKRGMSESELVVTAGSPDLLFRDRGLRTYTWLPTNADPFTTVVTVREGRVTELERERKF
jgi:hypothetical protein